MADPVKPSAPVPPADTRWPVFVFTDDTGLELCASIGKAQGEYEAWVVKEGDFEFADFHGRRLTPEFDAAVNRTAGWFWRLLSRLGGDIDFYRLKPGPDSASGGWLDEMLAGREYLAPNDCFASLEEVAAHFEALGHSLPLFRAKPCSGRPDGNTPT